MLADLGPWAAGFGTGAVILPGNMKDPMNKVREAKRGAEAILIARHVGNRAASSAQSSSYRGEATRPISWQPPACRSRAPSRRSRRNRCSARAARLAQWVPRNIRPQIGRFTSVEKALADRRGDCEEMSAVFVALCRAGGIPARLVWIPNHNWAEFYLTDEQG